MVAWNDDHPQIVLSDLFKERLLELLHRQEVDILATIENIATMNDRVDVSALDLWEECLCEELVHV